MPRAKAKVTCYWGWDEVSLPRDPGRTVFWNPSSPAFHRELRPAGSQDDTDEGTDAIWLTFQMRAGHPISTARLFVPSISKQPKKTEQEERKTIFYLYPTSLMK